MLLHFVVSEYLNDIEHDHGECHNYRLAGLQAIYSGQDVDGISAKNGQHAHEDIIQDPDIQSLAKQRSDDVWHYNGGGVKVDIVDH